MKIALNLIFWTIGILGFLMIFDVTEKSFMSSALQKAIGFGLIWAVWYLSPLGRNKAKNLD